MHKWKVDKPFLMATIILVVGGFFIFSSASLGLLARNGVSYSSVAFTQAGLGLFLGAIAMIAAARTDFKIWKKSALYILIVALALNTLVLAFGFEHGGAKRWIAVGDLSFQPSEFLKLAFVLYFAAWCAWAKDKMSTFRYGFLPLVILFTICGGLLLLQPDTDNLLVIIMAGMAMFIVAGGRWKYIFLLILAAVLTISILAMTRPYVKERINTFMHPEANSQGAGYQIQQSLIAIGSGGLFGRGFGQSVQKFNFLPEPIGDSIFAVHAEEWGFIGSSTLIMVFVFFATRGLKIASRVPDTFGRLTIVGIVIMIVSQAFVNMGAMLGVIPLSGITLPFVSHGGTSLFITLLEIGIILSISKTQRSR